MNVKPSALAVVLIALSTIPALADRPENPPGMARYGMVLWTPGIQLPNGEFVKNVEEPDVEKYGGRLVAKKDNRREILLPPAAAKQLRKHPAVVYLQRIWMGESFEGWDERHPGSRFDVDTDSDTNLEWVKALEYDGSGNIKDFGPDHYTYDSAGRLVKAEVSGKTERFKYDSFGNLIEKGIDGANPVTIPVDGTSNRMIGPEYDVAGNVTTRNGQPGYVFDALNSLMRVRALASSTRRILYDAQDERLGMIVDGDSVSRWTIRDFQGRVIREYRGENAGAGMWYWQLDEVYADGQLVAGESQAWGVFGGQAVYGGPRHYHLDHLGSVRLVTDENRQTISEHDYYPYGQTQTRTYQEQINGSDPHLDSMRFAGHWRDFLGLLNVENTEYLDYMHARYYDPNLGRFLSIDPVQGDPARPQSWNRYAYAENTPVNATDPTGMATFFGSIDVEASRYLFDALRQVFKAGMSALDSSVEQQRDRFWRVPQLRDQNRIRELNGEDLYSSWEECQMDASCLEADEIPLMVGGASRVSKLIPGLNDSQLGHVFRRARGHVNPTTVASQNRFLNLFSKVASNPANRVAPDNAREAAEGVVKYVQQFHGGQVWVKVQNGKVVQGGVNR